MPPPTHLIFNGTQASFAPVDGAGYYTQTFGSLDGPAMIVTVLERWSSDLGLATRAAARAPPEPAWCSLPTAHRPARPSSARRP